MVGVPRSSGCQLCRQRRVKCDEARPECGNCRKYGTGCPGYERAIKFVSGKHTIRSKGSRPLQTSNQKTTGAASSEASPSTTSTLSAAATTPESIGGGGGTSGTTAAAAVVATSLVASLQPNRALFIGTLMDMAQTRLASKDVSTFLGFFGRLKFDEFGTAAALDGAICSLSLHLMGKELADDSLVARSRTVYGWSLGALQVTLRHPTKWKTSETFCSAVLLCFFELFAGTSSPETWLQHAQGIATLMEQRGPAAHAQGNDAAILFSFRGILPEWRKVIYDGPGQSIYAPEAPGFSMQVVNSFFVCLADMPEVMWWGYPVRQALLAGRRVSPKRIQRVAEVAAANHERFAAWYEDFKKLGVELKEVPSKDPSSPYQVVLEHPVGWLGSMHMGYWASMLVLQELLIQCEWPVDYRDSQKELVQNILRSIESVGSGIMGPFRLGYSIRIVYEFVSVETQRWIISLLDKFSKRYAATDKNSYPSPRVDAQGYS
ncbi:transcriptional regulator family: Fungal Specific TF [Trichoderma aggressivum f. europaeum]|uniref:Transcriptional regulator family: Fungal Specific TF n=1 Tax=Trichoderma aggressivum f. europaeum TaxID=173218 RepID=A0AAE1I622_9HYPO|nr:transcriptional regulator family: Fungal Specific TF [Trichoderma aggressivum f. europaeum]